MTTAHFTSLPHDDSGFHSVCRLPMHSLQRPTTVPLDGDWDFSLVRDGEDTGAVSWKKAPVPGLWTMHEPDDPPHYLNVTMPFDDVPPNVPPGNAVGVYRREFEVPSTRDRLILHVGAAEGVLRVYINDVLVGTSSDSHLAAEFDITDAVRRGTNTVTLALTKWSALSYIEDQDQWWQWGITRSVHLYQRPAISVADISAVADFDPTTQRGSLTLEVSTQGLDHEAHVEHTVRVQILGRTLTLPVAPRLPDPSGATAALGRSTRPEPLIPPDTMDLFSEIAADAPMPPEAQPTADALRQTYLSGQKALPGTVGLSLPDLEVSPWSAEEPHLEAVEVELLAPNGTVVDRTALRVGFRRVVIEGRDLLVNGRRILIQGVNRHDVHPRTGRVLTRADMLAELSQLKRFNFNAIRTSHYPNDPHLLDLCDELGFYVVDEANIEAHAFMDTVSGDPRYLPAFLERVSRMVIRDRNHPSVLMWSLGNETGYGANHDAAAAWIRRFDPTRPLHYEGAISHDWHGGHAATDIVCPMYPSFRSLEAYSADPRADRPLILCEYAYSQGNGTGGLAHYWELFETLPGLQGGYIWEYFDHALDPDGDGRYRSGADFGDRPNDGDLMLNGIAFADGTPKPAMYEARALFSPVRILSTPQEALDGTLRLRNRQTFADLSAYTMSLHVDTRTDSEASAPVVLDLPACTEAIIDLPDPVRASLATDGALGVTLTVATKRQTAWAAAGTVVAEQQLALPVRSTPMPSGARDAPEIDENGDIRHPLLRRAPRLSLWRPLTDNDKSAPLDQRFVRSGFFRLTPESVSVKDSGLHTVITTHYRAAFGDSVTHRRTVKAVNGGDYVFDESVELPDGTTDGLRIGVEFELVDGFDQAEWVGLGPWENYPDRRVCARSGSWQSPIDDLAVRYMPPQENGGRGDVTKLQLSGPAGVVSTAHAVPLQMNVGRYTTEQLETAPHWWDLPSSAATIVHLDIAHRGVGTGGLGPDTRLPFRLSGSSYSWTWRLVLQERSSPRAGQTAPPLHAAAAKRA
ncbi:glycoside hydrolase family 2 TIM barrel-domain containing protein [Streptomyces sp. NPDC050433]|uniref:glycoside hydrolase family 2 TIM barrel-domain containing protein n=1 Tax=Streptomyces sp. NPDC050433 TaxID=3365615 RepID=UPI0037BDFB51